MKKLKHILIIWFALQVVTVFTAMYLLIHGRADIASTIFGVFNVQAMPFGLLVIFYITKVSMFRPQARNISK